jgi:hypothetical protein
LRNRRNVAARVVAGLALGAAAALIAACSPGADYPAVLDRPAPRAEQTMNPDQVKQATDALISDRDKLSAAQGTTPPVSAPVTTGSTHTTTGTAAKP